MTRPLMALLMLGLAGTAMASITGRTPDVVKDPGTPYVNPPASRIAGDTIAEPFILTGLGSVTGTTAGYTHDYDEVCPYSGSTAPDVVYAFTPTTSMSVDLDLCYSSFDTKLYVYDNTWTPGAPLACNDDFHSAPPCYTYTSKLESVSLVAGHTYYIVIDGYGGASGAYQLNVADAGIPPPNGACCALSGACTITTEVACAGVWQGENTNCVPNPCPPSPVTCPAGALIEGEPPCVPEGDDNYNGGCNSTPNIFQPLDAQAAGCAVLCGKGCANATGRDTDWFVSIGTGAPVTATCTAEFPLQFLLVYGTDCSSPAYLLGTGDPGVPVTLSWTVASDAEIWLWVGNPSFSDWPESGYVLSVCGIQGSGSTGSCCAVSGACTVTRQADCSAAWTMSGVCQPNPCCPLPPYHRGGAPR